MTGRGREGGLGSLRPVAFALATAGLALVPAEPAGLLVVAIAASAALGLAGYLRRPDRTVDRLRGDSFEDRLAKALEASESVRSAESDSSDALRSQSPENMPRVRGERSVNKRPSSEIAGGLPEGAVATAYELLSAEIAERMEAFRRREGDLRRRETEIEAERKRIESFRDELAKSIAQLRSHHERLEEIERELTARLRDTGTSTEFERTRG